MEKNSVIIRHAKGVLMNEGWVQGRLGYKGQPHCVLGAFAVAHGWAPDQVVEEDDDYRWMADEDEIYRRSPAAQAFAECINHPGSNVYGDSRIINWNDAYERQLDEVMAALEECAKREEAEGR